jgi:hypothetical protein
MSALGARTPSELDGTAEAINHFIIDIYNWGVWDERHNEGAVKIGGVEPAPPQGRLRRPLKPPSGVCAQRRPLIGPSIARCGDE